MYADNRRPRKPTPMRIWSVITRLWFCPAVSEAARIVRMMYATTRTRYRKGYIDEYTAPRATKLAYFGKTQLE